MCVLIALFVYCSQYVDMMTIKRLARLMASLSVLRGLFEHRPQTSADNKHLQNRNKMCAFNPSLPAHCQVHIVAACNTLTNVQTNNHDKHDVRSVHTTCMFGVRLTISYDNGIRPTVYILCVLPSGDCSSGSRGGRGDRPHLEGEKNFLGAYVPTGVHAKSSATVSTSVASEFENINIICKPRVIVYFIY